MPLRLWDATILPFGPVFLLLILNSLIYVQALYLLLVVILFIMLVFRCAGLKNLEWLDF